MKCPYCRQESTDVVNTRPTFHQTQVWRRRQCLNCGAVFTTYERADLGFIKVIKRSGRKERYNRAKLFAGIYGAYLSVPQKETTVDDITNQIEAALLDLQKKEISSSEITKAVLGILKTANPAAFLRFLAYNTAPKSLAEARKEIGKY